MSQQIPITSVPCGDSVFVGRICPDLVKGTRNSVVVRRKGCADARG